MDKYEKGLKEIEVKNRAFLAKLEGIPEETRSLLERCLSSNSEFGRYQFASFAYQLMAVLKLNSNWGNSDVSFAEVCETIRKIAIKERFSRKDEVVALHTEINKPLDELRLNLLQKFVPKIESMKVDDIWTLSGIFYDLGINREFRKKIVEANLENVLKIIEIVKKRNPHHARIWIDCIENQKLQAELNADLDKFCAEVAFLRIDQNSENLHAAHFYCDAIRDRTLQEQVHSQLPKIRLTEAEFLDQGCCY